MQAIATASRDQRFLYESRITSHESRPLCFLRNTRHGFFRITAFSPITPLMPCSPLFTIVRHCSPLFSKKILSRQVSAHRPAFWLGLTTGLHVSSRGEVKCASGPSGRGTSRAVEKGASSPTCKIASFTPRVTKHETRSFQFAGPQTFLLERTRPRRWVFTKHETRNTNHGLFETRPLRFNGHQTFLLEQTSPPPMVFTNHESRVTNHGLYVFHESRIRDTPPDPRRPLPACRPVTACLRAVMRLLRRYGAVWAAIARHGRAMAWHGRHIAPAQVSALPRAFTLAARGETPRSTESGPHSTANGAVPV